MSTVPGVVEDESEIAESINEPVISSETKSNPNRRYPTRERKAPKHLGNYELSSDIEDEFHDINYTCVDYCPNCLTSQSDIIPLGHTP